MRGGRTSVQSQIWIKKIVPISVSLKSCCSRGLVWRKGTPERCETPVDPRCETCCTARCGEHNCSCALQKDCAWFTVLSVKKSQALKLALVSTPPVYR